MTREHEKLCEVTDVGLIENLARDSEYCCVRCGATTHDKSSVCGPKLLEPDH
jgi:hypothetical protein